MEPTRTGAVTWICTSSTIHVKCQHPRVGSFSKCCLLVIQRAANDFGLAPLLVTRFSFVTFSSQLRRFSVTLPSQCRSQGCGHVTRPPVTGPEHVIDT